MNILRLRKNIQSILDNIEKTIGSRVDLAYAFINKYGYLLSTDQLRQLLFSRTIVTSQDQLRILVRSLAAYIDDEMLDQLPDWAVRASLPLLMRIPYERAQRINSRDPAVVGRWISATAARKRGIDWQKCCDIAVSHTAYRSIISGTIRDSDIPAALMDAARYATAGRLCRLVRAVYRRRLPLMQATKGKPVVYEMISDAWTNTFVNINNAEYLAAIPWRYAVKLAKAMLLCPCAQCEAVHIPFPELLRPRRRFLPVECPVTWYSAGCGALPHHKLASFMLRIAANVLQIQHNPSVYNWLKHTLRYGGLAAIISPRLRMHIGLCVPSIVGPRLFTAEEIRRIETVRIMTRVGTE